MLKPSVLRELKKIVGPANFSTSPEELLVYSYDATQQEALPWAVARPASSREISEVLKLANRERFPVVPRGAGTGMSGGSVPVRGGVVLSLERMNRILEIDEKDFIAVVEPGVITGALQRAVESRGLFYPPDPASHQFCTMGGNVAECAGGLRAVKYGVTKDYVLGLEVVLPTGEIINTGGRTVKSVAGYDLTKLIVGSEGTLGIATRITVKLLSLPESVRTLSAFFKDVQSAAVAAANIMAKGPLPRALELVDQAALRAVEGYLKEDLSQGAGAMLLVEMDGPEESTVRDAARAAELMTAAGAVRVNRAETVLEREQLWKARRSISPALYTIKPKKVSEDIVVPRSKIPDILSELGAIGKRHGLMIVNFGHAGDGNIHTNILLDEEDMPRVEAAVKEIFAATLRLGGSISGEHGIGLSKAPYLPMELGHDAIVAMRRIKQALDPNNILNPGKIFLNSEFGMRNKNMIKGKSIIVGNLAFLLISLMPVVGYSDVKTVPIEELRQEVQVLQQEAAQLEEENQGLRQMLKDQEDDELYLVVDTESSRLMLRQDNTVLLTAKAGTGSRQFMKEETGRSWYFETPMGSFTVLGKERNPVWIRPDWSYVEENMPIPPEGDPDRLVRGVLGKYALILGDGYKIHGTKWTNLLGTHFTHGCVSLGDDDLELVYKSVKVGTKVYLY